MTMIDGNCPEGDMHSYQHIEVHPITGALGAEIKGPRLDSDLDADVFREIQQAFLEHLVLFFRYQHLSLDELKIFAGRFGKLHIHPYTKPIEGYPEVLEIVKTPSEKHNWGGGWHNDMSSFERPTMGAVLQAVEVPQSGGDTQWANMNLAYETLSTGMKKLITGMRALYRNNPDSYVNFEDMETIAGEGSSAMHPFVRTHPQTGKRSLFFGRRKIVNFQDMSAEESAPLLKMLHDHAENPDFACRFRWTPGAVALWDNRCTIHRAGADYFHEMRDVTGSRRVMQRVSIEGTVPV